MLSDEMRAEGWLPHDGGPCPKGIGLDDPVAVMMLGELSGGYVHEVHAADCWDWMWGDGGPHGYDIIAYKPENPDD